MTEEASSEATLSNLLREERTFPPPAAFAEAANVKANAYEEARDDRIEFWEDKARRLSWSEPWHTALEWDAPFAKWFVGGKLNVAYNCVDRHVEAGNGDRVAIHWEGEPGDTRTITYSDLQKLVAQAAHALHELGVRPGDRVMIYLPMIPEAAVAMLACARLGAAHSVVFGGFSADSLRNRIDDAQAKIVITADGGYRRGKPSALKPAADEAIAGTGVEKVLVVKRTNEDVPWTEGRDVWWHDIVERQPTEHEHATFDAENPLFILYTSGTTAKPKGILHTSGGYLTQASWTHHAVFDLKPETDIYWCAADIGWVTGHSYIVYGPLSNGVTQVMYEGTPDTPHQGRFWEIIQKYKVTILYTAPTTIRTFMKWGADIPAKFDLSTLRLLGSVGEPINPEAWIWYRHHIGGDNCPIVDTWWQTETGAIMISPLPGVTETKPGSAQRALPGISVEVVDEGGKPVPDGGGGYLVLTEPWPSMLRGIWGDDERYKETYWSRYADQGYYFAGDGAKKDDDGDLWLLGRVDDVMNVSGHRISTTEVESALVSHPSVAEAAVVGATDPTTGQGIVAFVILRGDAEQGTDPAAELRQHVAREIGPIAKPRQILVVPELPKTRSGKIMRRLLRDVAENRSLGDVTTLADPTVMNLISAGLSGNAGKED
ncbi:acetate--CoA ligase [Cryptosporangium aurantiacum]|uniref:Acetyl-coenzyme A synthetase n=1 Tax=Cryptosporangium aurantiacum TaxID=134849 RepID=A0A1M7NGJ5_9ACTN|nr:acetate--CoA ligase [Cryptosporangium aurantiacum]SHN02918.1 acetyl-coenzyme A synthetase [Cryptosporangium aurantiacum]